MNFPCSRQGQCHGMWMERGIGFRYFKVGSDLPPMTTLTTAGRAQQRIVQEQISEQLNKFWKCAESKYNPCPWARSPRVSVSHYIWQGISYNNPIPDSLNSSRHGWCAVRQGLMSANQRPVFWASDQSEASIESDDTWETPSRMSW